MTILPHYCKDFTIISNITLLNACTNVSNDIKFKVSIEYLISLYRYEYHIEKTDGYTALPKICHFASPNQEADCFKILKVRYFLNGKSLLLYMML